MEPGAEPSRRLSRGPRITLTCECGARKDLRYGERWRCEQCGRTWDTHRIPAEDYAAVRRIRRRFVVIPMAVLALFLATIALFIVFGRIYAFVLLPLLLSFWSMYGRPIHRRRLRRALDNAPQWNITPE